MVELVRKGGWALKLRKGDTVQVISGNNTGKRGKIIQALPKVNKVVVENVNIRKKHVKPTQTSPQGGITEFPAPIDASNVMLVCSKCNAPVRIKINRLEDGKRVRVCRKCGREVS